jgi:hypothetical protein
VAPVNLYDLPRQWVDYDPQKKQFVRTPSLSSWAVPKAKGTGEKITPEQGKALEALLWASKGKLEGLAEPTKCPAPDICTSPRPCLSWVP